MATTNNIQASDVTAKSIPAGMKNSSSEGFWLANHKDTHIPIMMEPFSPPAARFFWPSVSHPQAPLWKGLDKAAVEGY